KIFLNSNYPKLFMGFWRRGALKKITLQRFGKPEGEVRVALYTLPPSEDIPFPATPDDDYQHQDEYETWGVVWADGDLTDKDVFIDIVDDSLFEEDETFVVRLLGLSGKEEILGPDRVPVVIRNSDLPEVGFDRSSYATGENPVNGVVNVQVKRYGIPKGIVRVEYEVRGDTADIGHDFHASSGFFVWDDKDETDKEIPISIVDDERAEGSEYIEIELTQFSNANIRGENPVRLTIRPNDQRVVEFIGDSFEVNEGTPSGKAVIFVERRGDPQGEIHVTFKTSHDSKGAQSPADFEAVVTQLVWPSGDVTNKKVEIPIVNDTQYEGRERFEVYLTNASAETHLGRSSRESFTILDDDAAIRFGQSGFEVEENTSTGKMVIELVRLGSPEKPLSFELVTEDRTAVAGRDFESVSRVQEWNNPPETGMMIEVPIIDNTLEEGNKDLKLVLDSFNEGQQSSHQEIILTIHDDEHSDFAELELRMSSFLDMTGTIVDVKRDLHGEIILMGEGLFAGVKNQYPMATSLGEVRGPDIWFAKMSSDGTQIQWMTFVGGSREDGSSTGFEITDTGDIVFGGFTHSPDFPIVDGFQNSLNGTKSDGFVAKLASDGASILYSSYFGGRYLDSIEMVVLGNSPHVYIGGITVSPDLPNATNEYGGGSRDGFIAKIALDGSEPPISRYVGWNWGSEVFDVALDPDYFPIIGAQVSSRGYELSPGNFRENWEYGVDLYVAKLDSNLQLVKESFFGGPLSDNGASLKTDQNGNIFVAGDLNYESFSILNANQPLFGGGRDIFLVKFDSDLNPIFSSYGGGASIEHFGGMNVDEYGFAYVTGHTYSEDLEVSPNAFQKNLQGNADTFLQIFNPEGRIVYSTFFGSHQLDTPRGIDTNSNGTIILHGETCSGDFPITPNALQNDFQSDCPNFFSIFSVGLSDFDTNGENRAPVANAGPTPIILDDQIGDGIINLNDFHVLLMAWNTHPNDPNWNSLANVYYEQNKPYENQRINSLDLNVMAQALGSHVNGVDSYRWNSVCDIDGEGVETLQMDGSGSYDLDGTIKNYFWEDERGNIIANSVSPHIQLNVGTHHLALRVQDNLGAFSEKDEVLITINKKKGSNLHNQQDCSQLLGCRDLSPSFSSSRVGIGRIDVIPNPNPEDGIILSGGIQLR
ncbi:hypothetical protein BVX98_07585, partial [bacterium F11]